MNCERALVMPSDKSRASKRLPLALVSRADNVNDRKRGQSSMEFLQVSSNAASIPVIDEGDNLIMGFKPQSKISGDE